MPMRPERPSYGLLVGFGAAVAVMAAAASHRAWWPLLVAAALAASGLHVLLWRRDALRVRDVLWGALLLRLAFFWLLPDLSDDAFRYVWDGWIQTDGINPFVVKPSDPALASYQDTVLYTELNSAGYYTVYPPVSQLIFWVGGWFVPFGWEVGYYVIKGLLVGLELGGVVLLSRLVDARSLLLYAWQPVVLIEVAGQAHTESAMVLFLVATLWFVALKRPGWASAALTAAGWVKLYPLVLLPLLWRRYGWRAVWPVGVVSAGLWLPYADLRIPDHMAESLDLYVRYFEFNAGPYYAVKGLFRLVTGEDWSKQLGPAFRLLFVVLLPVVYAIDWRRQWALHRSMLYILGGYFLLATTVHPWYWLGILPLLAFYEHPPWPWYVLATLSIGTYLLYVDGPYWLFVWLGWGAALGVAVVQYGDPLLQEIQYHRGVNKYRRLISHLPSVGEQTRMLDLGAGEGYVGAAFRRNHEADVVLADVIDLNRTDLPHVRYDGRRLPFDDDAFDVTLLVFVLHHSASPEDVLQEALRVTKGTVVIWESIYDTTFDRRVLEVLDRWVNRLRSRGLMRGQEEHLHFRTARDWLITIRHCATSVPVAIETHRFGLFPHKQLLLIVDNTRYCNITSSTEKPSAETH